MLASADVVVMPSRYETYGLVAAEALAVATPVVAFTIPCLRNVVDDGRTGVLVDAFDVAAFAEGWRGLSATRPGADLSARPGPIPSLGCTGICWRRPKARSIAKSSNAPPAVDQPLTEDQCPDRQRHQQDGSCLHSQKMMASLPHDVGLRTHRPVDQDPRFERCPGLHSR